MGFPGGSDGKNPPVMKEACVWCLGREDLLDKGRVAAAAAAKVLQSCPTLCDPIDSSPLGSPRPWNSPGKNTGVGCHFLLQCMKVKMKSLNHVGLLATPWTAPYQVPPSMGFSRQSHGWRSLVPYSPWCGKESDTTEWLTLPLS